jgi:hypothetical protein
LGNLTFYRFLLFRKGAIGIGYTKNVQAKIGSGNSTNIGTLVTVKLSNNQQTVGDVVVGDGTAGSCDETSLKQGITDILDNQILAFDCGTAMHTITLTSGQINITKTFTIDGGSLITLAGNNSCVFNVLDNQTFTGQWEVQEDTKLILKNLSPHPTGTNGIIEYSITQLSDNALKLTRTATSVKTGNTLNNYELINQ